MSSLIVGIAEIRFTEPPFNLVTYGLGSCVAIVLHSPKAGIGGMAHVMLPYAYNEKEKAVPGKFAGTAVNAMLEEFTARGIGPNALRAKIAGGADMFNGRFQGTGSRVGDRNILAVRKALKDFHVDLVAEDVGGNAGRTVEFMVETGLVMVRTLRGEVKNL